MDSERGQASIELVAALPVVVLLGALVWQLALAGHAAWLTANAARSAARAELVGRSPRSAALSALPRSMERGLRVERVGESRGRVSVRVPWLLTRAPSPLRVAAESSLGEQP
jgi:hypothetical protein